jgi:IS1 family transposase
MNKMLDKSRISIIFAPQLKSKQMNKLPLEKRTQIINLLVEGNSLRATSRIADVSINTVTKLLVDVDRACEKFHDNHVVGVNAKRVQADEIWSFVYSKEGNIPEEKRGEEGIGDVWTWTAIDADTKLMISWYVGDRTKETATLFMKDLADRVTDRIQLTTDSLNSYISAVYEAFGTHIDYARLTKIYGADPSVPKGKYSPAICTGVKRDREIGCPDKEHISTSYVERQNLTMRMHMRRFTRLTNAFSKKIENHCHAIALHFVYYNFCKVHKTLRVTPAMAAGLTQDIMSLEELVKLAD